MKPLRSVFRWYVNTNLLLRILIALVGGAIVGLAVGAPVVAIRPLGTRSSYAS